MLNKNSNIVFFIILFIILPLVTTGCSRTESNILSVDKEGNTTISNEAVTEAINQEPPQALTDVEREGILYVREEEKLARDVYSQLYKVWGLNNMNNIASSEQTHLDAMKSLIDRYGLDDPVTGMGTGEFRDPKLQQLYNELVEKGSKSEIDALEVGAAIEEIDIIDIEEYVAQTDKQDIIIVYENLMKGSRNHLRYFVSVLEKRGVTYNLQYLPSDEYNAIVNSDVERGRN